LSAQPENTQQTPAPPPEKRSLIQRIFVRRGIKDTVLIPILAVFTALVVGGVIIAISTPVVREAWSNFFQAPWEAIKITIETIWNAYVALFVGAFGSPTEIINGFRTWIQTGNPVPLIRSLRPIGESLMLTTPYIFAGLAVALGFRGGLFNIGAEGQIFVGGLAAAFVGYSLKGLPAIIHLPLALLAAILAGAVWAGIPGYLKARFGAHEVINTIMMNYIAFRLADYLLQGPMSRPDRMPITPEILKSAYLPTLLPAPVRVHFGLIIALFMAWVVYWFLWKTPRGLEIRMVGANPNAARYAGIRIALIIVLTMCLSGALAGMAGANQVLGVEHRMVRSFSSGYGFDSIALALLGNSHPLGVVLSSFLFGFLRGGAAQMQVEVGVPIEIIKIIQGLIIIFVAAPEIIRSLYRLKPKEKKEILVAKESQGSS
jgi:general nucleoside transport system permease protein